MAILIFGGLAIEGILLDEVDHLEWKEAPSCCFAFSFLFQKLSTSNVALLNALSAWHCGKMIGCSLFLAGLCKLPKFTPLP